MIVNPYESPKSPHEQAPHSPRTDYRTKFWPVYFVAVPLTTGVAAGTVLLMRTGIDIPFQPWVIVQLSLVACLLLTAFLTLFFRVFLSDSGIRCFDFWGRYHETPWEAIEEGKPINLFGLRYLRLVATGHPTLWLPLFIHQQDDFWRDVEGLMPEHVVTSGQR